MGFYLINSSLSASCGIQSILDFPTETLSCYAYSSLTLKISFFSCQKSKVLDNKYVIFLLYSFRFDCNRDKHIDNFYTFISLSQLASVHRYNLMDKYLTSDQGFRVRFPVTNYNRAMQSQHYGPILLLIITIALCQEVACKAHMYMYN